MDNAYNNAVAQREAAEKRIAVLKQELEAATHEHQIAVQFLVAWEHFSGVNRSARDETGPVIAPGERESSRRGTNPPKEEVAELALKAIREVGKPMFRAILYKEMVDRGLTLQGKDPIVVLSTMLWRTKTMVTFVKGHGYWPYGEPLPDGRVPDENGIVEETHDFMSSLQ